jgi:hypothetical protein
MMEFAERRFDCDARSALLWVDVLQCRVQRVIELLISSPLLFHLQHFTTHFVFSQKSEANRKGGIRDLYLEEVGRKRQKNRMKMNHKKNHKTPTKKRTVAVSGIKVSAHYILRAYSLNTRLCQSCLRGCCLPSSLSYICLPAATCSYRNLPILPYLPTFLPSYVPMFLCSYVPILLLPYLHTPILLYCYTAVLL